MNYKVILKIIYRHFAWICEEICPTCGNLWTFKFDLTDEMLHCNKCDYKKQMDGD